MEIFNKIRICALSANANNSQLSDEEFITLAEKEGSINSLKGFEYAFNRNEIQIENVVIRIMLPKDDSH
jgi:hypothetical protein